MSVTPVWGGAGEELGREGEELAGKGVGLVVASTTRFYPQRWLGQANKGRLIHCHQNSW